MRSLVKPIYAEMDRDPDYRELGSAMGAVYRDLAHLPLRSGHYYVYMPEVAAGERIPCLIFLHGMGGNLKAYVWLLSRLSKKGTGSELDKNRAKGENPGGSVPVPFFGDQLKCAIIAPTFGNGNWDQPGGAELAVAVAREALDTLPIDPRRIYLMGYSNGALGVTRAVILDPALFAGLIYLSPVTEDELFSTREFLGWAHGQHHEILFLQGRDDRRIPPAFVNGTVARLKSLGCDVRLKVFDDDHYLIFSQPRGGARCAGLGNYYKISAIGSGLTGCLLHPLESDSIFDEDHPGVLCTPGQSGGP